MKVNFFECLSGLKTKHILFGAHDESHDSCNTLDHKFHFQGCGGVSEALCEWRGTNMLRVVQLSFLKLDQNKKLLRFFKNFTFISFSTFYSSKFM
jgi:hypothetical protein